MEIITEQISGSEDLDIVLNNFKIENPSCKISFYTISSDFKEVHIHFERGTYNGYDIEV